MALWLDRKGGDESEHASRELVPLLRGPIAAVVSATGTVSSANGVQVGSQVSGTIQHLYVDFNDQVEKGQIIAQIDPAIFEAQLAEAQAKLENAEAARKAHRNSWRPEFCLFTPTASSFNACRKGVERQRCKGNVSGTRSMTSLSAPHGWRRVLSDTVRDHYSESEDARPRDLLTSRATICSIRSSHPSRYAAD